MTGTISTATAACQLTLSELLLCARHWYFHHPYFQDKKTEAQQDHKLEQDPMVATGGAVTGCQAAAPEPTLPTTGCSAGTARCLRCSGLSDTHSCPRSCVIKSQVESVCTCTPHCVIAAHTHLHAQVLYCTELHTQNHLHQSFCMVWKVFEVNLDYLQSVPHSLALLYQLPPSFCPRHSKASALSEPWLLRTPAMAGKDPNVCEKA